MKKRSPKSKSTRKTEQDRPCWKTLTLVKVNGQRFGMLTWDADVAVWHHSRADMAGCDTVKARGVHGSAWEGLMARGVRAREVETSAGACRLLWGGFWPFLVGFCSELSDLSIYALTFVVWSTKLMKSECSRGCGHNGGDLLLTVITGWKRGQWKNARDVHRN